MARNYVVTAFCDKDVGVWVATSEDVPGLVTEADSVDALIRKLKVMVPEMLELNGVIKGQVPSVPFQLMTQVDGATNQN
jgi:predicted RNase H-like HicB family nuclease